MPHQRVAAGPPVVYRRRATDAPLRFRTTGEAVAAVAEFPWSAWSERYGAGVTRIVRVWLEAMPALVGRLITAEDLQRDVLPQLAASPVRAWAGHLVEQLNRFTAAALAAG